MADVVVGWMVDRIMADSVAGLATVWGGPAYQNPNPPLPLITVTRTALGDSAPYAPLQVYEIAISTFSKASMAEAWQLYERCAALFKSEAKAKSGAGWVVQETSSPMADVDDTGGHVVFFTVTHFTVHKVG